MWLKVGCRCESIEQAINWDDPETAMFVASIVVKTDRQGSMKQLDY